MLPVDTLALTCAVGGLIGSAARAAFTTSQPLFSRKSLGDLFIGVLVGLLWPAYGPIDFPANATLLTKGAIVAFAAYVAGDAIMNVFTRASGIMQKLGADPTPTPPPTK